MSAFKKTVIAIALCAPALLGQQAFGGEASTIGQWARPAPKNHRGLVGRYVAGAFTALALEEGGKIAINAYKNRRQKECVIDGEYFSGAACASTNVQPGWGRTF